MVSGSILTPNPLEASVLVLNRLYMAVHIVSARRAFTLLCKELAEVVDTTDNQWQSFDFLTWRDLSEARRQSKSPDDDWVRTVSTEIQVPRIIRLTSLIGCPSRRSSSTDATCLHVMKIAASIAARSSQHRI